MDLLEVSFADSINMMKCMNSLMGVAGFHNNGNGCAYTDRGAVCRLL